LIWIHIFTFRFGYAIAGFGEAWRPTLWWWQVRMMYIAAYVSVGKDLLFTDMLQIVSTILCKAYLIFRIPKVFQSFG
jgi:hypothetical protein